MSDMGLIAEHHCSRCHLLVLDPRKNYGINPDAVCKCPPLMEQGLGIGYDPSKSRLQSANSALDRASIPAMNITNAVPPICTKHHETMVLSFYDRPGSPPGNGYSCRSCTQERLASPPEPKMQRAIAEGEFNVVGDELRKLEKKGDSMFRALSEYVSDRTTVICDGITRIESQLTALRAEADKGRAGLFDLRLVMNENMGKLRDDLNQFHNDFKLNADRWTTRLDMGDIYHAIKGKKSALEQLKATHKEAKKRTRKMGGK